MNKLTNQPKYWTKKPENESTNNKHVNQNNQRKNHKTKLPTKYNTKINKTTNNPETKTKQQTTNKHKPKQPTSIPNAPWVEFQDWSNTNIMMPHCGMVAQLLGEKDESITLSSLVAAFDAKDSQARR